MPNILIVEDKDSMRNMLHETLTEEGYRVDSAANGKQAFDLVSNKSYDLVLTDLRMPEVDGLTLLNKVKELDSDTSVIVMTAYSSVETAVQALKAGAYDYLTKPLDFDKLRLAMDRAMEHLALRQENIALKELLGERFDRRNIIGGSPAMQRLLDTVAQVAPTEATVLISGESGTGKELIAGALHYNSARRTGPFVKLNCAAVTETLLESELFGHERGAFTGAERRREGRFVQAEGGSLFLDEVSEMSLTMQVKLLRVLQERELTRVGGEAVIRVDVRVIAATNRALAERIRQGVFREDLFYRLNVVGLEIPPLRERRDDIPLLAQHFLINLASKNRKPVRGFSPQAMDLLVRHSWPGNVRELMNAVERGVVLSRGEFIDAGDLPLVLSPTEEVPSPDTLAAIDQPLDAVERQAILGTLSAAQGNKSETARRLGITRKTLHQKLKKYGVMP